MNVPDLSTMDRMLQAGVIDLILAGVVVEAGVLLALRYRTGRGVAGPVLVVNLAAGACLLIALRLVLAGDDHRAWAAASLLLALLAHVADLALRWERGAHQEPAGQGRR